MDRSEIYQRIGRLTPKQRDLLLKQAGVRPPAPTTRDAPPQASTMPPTPAQSAMWLHAQLNPRSASYNLSVLYHASPPLLRAPLRAALSHVLARHDALRMTFTALDGKPRITFGTQVEAPLTVLSFAPGTRDEDVVVEMKRVEADAFALHAGPLACCVLAEVGTRGTHLLVKLHHSVCDGGSLPILMRDIGVAYRSAEAGSEPKRSEVAQFSSYVRRQAAWLETEDAAKSLSYWRENLHGACITELPSQALRPVNQTYNGMRIKLTCGGDWVLGMERFATAKKTTVFTVLLAGLAVLVGRYADQDDLTIGAPFEARGDSRFEHTVGNFVNPLPLRIRLAEEMTFSDLVDECHRTVLGALRHQSTPFDTLLTVSQQARDPSRNPLFQIFLNRSDYAEPLVDLPELTAVPLLSDSAAAKFDLTIYNSSSGSLTAVYNSDLYDEDYIRSFLDRYVALLGEATVDPMRPISCYLQPPRAVVRPDPAPVRDTDGDTDGDTVARRFLSVCELHARRPAIVEDGIAVSYARLKRHVARLAWKLRSLPGEQSGAVVICADSGLEAVAGQFAALLSGRCFVPLDPSNPPARMHLILDAVSPAAIIHSRRHAGVAAALNGRRGTPIICAGEDDGEDGRDVPIETLDRADALAYVLFTSGTTGTPKGVLQSNRNLLRHIEAYAASIRVTPDDRLSQFAWFGFDAAIMDVFAALLRGACLVPVDLKSVGLTALRDTLAHNGVTILHPTPTLFRYMLGADEDRRPFSRVRAVVLGGEEVLASDFQLFKRHFPAEAVFINGYGPSESTTAMQHHMDRTSEVRGQRVPVGRPVAGIEISLRTPAGESPGLLHVGEILITGDRIALGYLDAVEETARAFRAVDGSTSRTYWTGDLGRYVDDGVIEFIGRRDGQVKIRGNRIELFEIRAAMEALKGVSAAAVVARKAASGDKTLVGYYASDAALDPAQMHGLLRERLPGYLVPTSIVRLDEIPFRANGKLDEARLPPEPVETAPRPKKKLLSEEEELVETTWRQVLRVADISSDVNFFDIGGHSLLMVEVHERLNRAGCRLSLIDMFQYPTIQAMAQFIKQTKT